MTFSHNSVITGPEEFFCEEHITSDSMVSNCYEWMMVIVNFFSRQSITMNTDLHVMLVGMAQMRVIGWCVVTVTV